MCILNALKIGVKCIYITKDSVTPSLLQCCMLIVIYTLKTKSSSMQYLVAAVQADEFELFSSRSARRWPFKCKSLFIACKWFAYNFFLRRRWTSLAGASLKSSTTKSIFCSLIEYYNILHDHRFRTKIIKCIALRVDGNDIANVIINFINKILFDFRSKKKKWIFFCLASFSLIWSKSILKSRSNALFMQFTIDTNILIIILRSRILANAFESIACAKISFKSAFLGVFSWAT